MLEACIPIKCGGKNENHGENLAFFLFYFISDGYGKYDSLSIQDQRSDRSNSFHSEVVYALALLYCYVSVYLKEPRRHFSINEHQFAHL